MPSMDNLEINVKYNKGLILINYQEHPEKEKILDLVKNAVEYANMVVYEKSQEVEELNGMGTTIDVAIIQSGKLYIGHVGDSRVYRLRKEFFRKLTVDHSYVEQLLKQGNITKEEAYNHPKKNMLTKALGCTAYVEPDVMVKGYQKGDVLLMCTDGLTNMIREEQIFQILKDNPEQACDILVDKANENGGLDNITAVIIL